MSTFLRSPLSTLNPPPQAFSDSTSTLVTETEQLVASTQQLRVALSALDGVPGAPDASLIPDVQQSQLDSMQAGKAAAQTGAELPDGKIT